MLVTSALLAVVAAGCNAASSTMQRKANRQMPASRRLNASMLTRIIRQPAWLLGFAAMLVSFLLQGLALRLGPLAVVEPVLAVELPLTLLFASVLFKRRLPRQDWVAVGVMAAGLAVFVATLAPSGGDAQSVPTSVTAPAAAGTAVGIGLIAAIAALGPQLSRAALYGVAAGAGFGLTASLLKLVVSRFDQLFVSWPTYAMAAAGACSVLLVQAALHAGTLVAAQPGLTLVDPLVSLMWGIVIFGEAPRTGPILVLTGLAALAIIVAVLALARASAAEHSHDPESPAARGDRQVPERPSTTR